MLMKENTTVPSKPNFKGLKEGTKEFKARSREIRNWRLLYEPGYKERVRNYTKTYSTNNAARIKEINNKLENRVRRNMLQTQRRLKNYEKHRAYHKAYFDKNYQTSPYFRLNHILRVGLRDSLRDGYDKCDCFGCSIVDLKAHLEQQFMDGMNWTNHGKAWHIDHIISLSQGIKLGLSSDSVWNYVNLQPLPIHVNLSKKDHLQKQYMNKILAHPDAPDELVDIALALLSY